MASTTLWGERAVALTAIALALFMASEAWEFPAGGDSFPLFISTCIIVLALMMLVRTFLAPADYARRIDVDLSYDALKPLIVGGIAVLYVLTIFILGYYTSTLLFLAGVPFIVGLRRPVFPVAVAVSAVLFIYLVFQMGLQANLPRGLLL